MFDPNHSPESGADAPPKKAARSSEGLNERTPSEMIATSSPSLSHDALLTVGV
jgi:hypothetical protein